MVFDYWRSAFTAKNWREYGPAPGSKSCLDIEVRCSGRPVIRVYLFNNFSFLFLLIFSVINLMNVWIKVLMDDLYLSI